MTLKLAVGIVLLVALAAAPTAGAVDRYAAPAPSGSGDCTSAANACSLPQAVGGAAVNDRVLVLGSRGDYALSADLSAGVKVDIVGVEGRPRLVFPTDGLELTVPGSSASNLRIETVNGRALVLHGSKGDRLFMKGSADADDTCLLGQSSTLTNSLCWAAGEGANALRARPSLTGTTELVRTVETLRNVTVVAPGAASRAISVRGGYRADVDLVLVNVIARGAAADLHLVGTRDPEDPHVVDVAASHVNYSTVVTTEDGASTVDDDVKQTAAPIFENAAAGDFRQAQSSPTIDAGENSPSNGAFDFDGDPRTLNGTTDIGFDEALPAQPLPPPPPVAPVALTGGASGITPSIATVEGTVDPSGSPTTYHFDFGTTTSYGRSTPAVDAGGGVSAVGVTAVLDGLASGTTYHYRLVATNAGGTTFGADREFTTTQLPGGPCANVIEPGAALVGTPLGDTLPGTPAADRISGAAGDDCIDGFGGKDQLDGDEGNDVVRGGADNDKVDGGDGDDKLHAGSGNDTAAGGDGVDSISGSSGNDRLKGGAGPDKLSGGGGADNLLAEDDDDHVSGGAGNDTLNAGKGRDRVEGSAGNDRISARDKSRDTINCGSGSDRVTADRVDKVSSNCERVSRR